MSNSIYLISYISFPKPSTAFKQYNTQGGFMPSPGAGRQKGCCVDVSCRSDCALSGKLFPFGDDMCLLIKHKGRQNNENKTQKPGTQTTAKRSLVSLRWDPFWNVNKCGCQIQKHKTLSSSRDRVFLFFFLFFFLLLFSFLFFFPFFPLYRSDSLTYLVLHNVCTALYRCASRCCGFPLIDIMAVSPSETLGVAEKPTV